jgi:SAM-dependent methyltransferase
VADVTVGDHFERVAAVYESLRTTDEAPVRRIREFLPDRPVTGLDIGCGTGRYSRLLRGLLPDGSLLVASDVSAAMLAELKASNHGHAPGVVPLLSTAEELPLRTASLDLVTAFNCVHHFDLGRFLTAVGRVLRPGGQLFIYTRTPQQNARTIWGRYFPGFTEREQRLHSEATFRDAVRRTDGLTVVATQTFNHPRLSTAGRLRAQAEGRHYSTFSLYSQEELRESIATFLARLPSPEVSWVDEHLLVVVGGPRNQAEPDGPGSLASQAGKDQVPQISAGCAGKAPREASRRPAPHRRQAPASAPASPPAQARPGRNNTSPGPVPLENRIRLVSRRSSVPQAACVYSLIRPSRDLLCVDVGHGGAGNVRVAVGDVLCDALARLGRVVVRL